MDLVQCLHKGFKCLLIEWTEIIWMRLSLSCVCLDSNVPILLVSISNRSPVVAQLTYSFSLSTNVLQPYRSYEFTHTFFCRCPFLTLALSLFPSRSLSLALALPISQSWKLQTHHDSTLAVCIWFLKLYSNWIDYSLRVLVRITHMYSHATLKTY